MSDKLTIIHRDGSKTEVEMLKMWEPGDFQPYETTLQPTIESKEWDVSKLKFPSDFPEGSLDRAMFCCMVRGYIARDAKPKEKYWRNTLDWKTLPERLSIEDKSALDWRDYDPQEDDGPLTA